ncbi:MAG: ankyrin repeat domain-containing protein [Burkholderiaceae bacterium]
MIHLIAQFRVRRLGSVLLMALALVLGACASLGPENEGDGREALRAALSEHRFDDAQALIERHAPALTRLTALDIGLRLGDLDVVNRFVPADAVDIALDPQGASPLIRAVISTPDPRVLAVVARLLALGASPDRPDRRGDSAMVHARRRGNAQLIEMLGSASADAAGARGRSTIADSWLPMIERRAWMTLLDGRAVGRPSGKGRSRQARPAAAAPMREGIGWLLGSTWLPVLRAQDALGGTRTWPALRFHADGTGEVLRYSPSGGLDRAERAGALAWDHYRGIVYFFAIFGDFASHCRSEVGVGDRFAVSCTDFQLAGGPWDMRSSRDRAVPAARYLLDSAQERQRLERAGSTESILEAEAGRLCRPRQAPVRARQRSAGAPTGVDGGWNVFDPRRLELFVPVANASCSQYRAYRAAMQACRQRGGRCFSVGGCRADQATAVAGVRGHDWAWVACAPSLAQARAKALATCARMAACDCQLLGAERPWPAERGPGRVACRAAAVSTPMASDPRAQPR